MVAKRLESLSCARATCPVADCARVILPPAATGGISGQRYWGLARSPVIQLPEMRMWLARCPTADPCPVVAASRGCLLSDNARQTALDPSSDLEATSTCPEMRRAKPSAKTVPPWTRFRGFVPGYF